MHTVHASAPGSTTTRRCIEWSLAEPQEFWAQLWRDSADGRRAAADRWSSPAPSMPTTRFFPDATVSVVETPSCAARVATPRSSRSTSAARRRVCSWTSLRVAERARWPAALRAGGRRRRRPRRGVAAERHRGWWSMLGAASIGAVFSSCSPDFGAEGVLDRFGQIEPKVLFAADGYSYGGKQFDCRARGSPRSRAGLPTLVAAVVVARRAATSPGRSRGTTSLAPARRRRVALRAVRRSTTRGTCCTRRAPPACRSASCTAPAACCCTHLKEHQLHCDIRAGDASSTSRPPAG